MPRHVLLAFGDCARGSGAGQLRSASRRRAAAAGAGRDRRASRRLRRAVRAPTPSISAATARSLGAAGAGDARGAGAVAAPASRGRGAGSRAMPTAATPATMRSRSGRGGPRSARLSDPARGSGGAAVDDQLGQGAADGHARRARANRRINVLVAKSGGAALEAGGASQARAWRWASAISRAVISSAISARHSWPRVQPDKAARLNHLCASMRSTETPAASGRIGDAQARTAHRHRPLRHPRAGSGSGTPLPFG